MMTRSYLNRLCLPQHFRLTSRGTSVNIREMCGFRGNMARFTFCITRCQRSASSLLISPHINMQMFEASSTYGSGHGVAVWAGSSSGRRPSGRTLTLSGNNPFCLSAALFESKQRKKRRRGSVLLFDERGMPKLQPKFDCSQKSFMAFQRIHQWITGILLAPVRIHSQYLRKDSDRPYSINKHHNGTFKENANMFL